MNIKNIKKILQVVYGGVEKHPGILPLNITFKVLISPAEDAIPSL